MAIKFGTGGASGSSIGEQLNDKFWSKVAVKEAKLQTIFSQMGSKETQPKHYGDTIKKYHELPIMHASNINDQGIDANGVKLTAGKWYAYDAAGAMVGDVAGYATEADALAVAGAVTSKSGNGNLYGGSRNLSTQNGAFPALREIGGKVNAVGMKREVIEAKVTEFGYAIPFTKKSLEMDTEVNLKARFSRGVGEAYGTLREAQIRNGLISIGMDNKVRAGASVATDADMNRANMVTYTTLRLLDKALKDARVPKDTKIIDGSTKIGTRTIQAGRYIYVGSELIPTLEDMTVTVAGDVKHLWTDVSEYAAGGNIAKGEIGRIGAWRFIEVEEMPRLEGAGKADGAAGSDDDTEGYNETNGHFDLSPMLFVGSDSFATVGFEGDVARVQTAMPKMDANSDWYGKNGVVSLSYYFGLLALRPERIRTILTTSKVA